LNQPSVLPFSIVISYKVAAVCGCSHLFRCVVVHSGAGLWLPRLEHREAAIADLINQGTLRCVIHSSDLGLRNTFRAGLLVLLLHLSDDIHNIASMFRIKQFFLVKESGRQNLEQFKLRDDRRRRMLVRPPLLSCQRTIRRTTVRIIW
jgi:hypothetical protein